MKPEILESKRIVLRPLRISDAKALVTYVNDREITKYLSFGPPLSLKQEQDFVRRTRKEWKNGTGFTWAITASGKLIGTICFQNFNKQHERAELGLWLAREWQGKGIGKEAARLAIDWAFKKLKLNRVDYGAFAPNKASIALIKSLGGKREGLRRRYWKKGSKYYDGYSFGILRKEWKC